MKILKTFFLGLSVCGVLLFTTAAKNVSFSSETKSELDLISIEKNSSTAVAEYSATDMKQIRCMAENLYFEARGEPLLGKIAVNNVVMNRVNDPQGRFGKTPCDVINQITYNKRKQKVCQFSWKCEKNKVITNQQKFVDLMTLSHYTYYGAFEDVTEGSKFYHATYVNPRWNLKKVTKIGQHIFYREPDKL